MNTTPSAEPAVGLAIQGGAMRSIYCIGATRSLLDGGHLAKLKSVAVSSAGCVAGVLLVQSRGDVTAFARMTTELLDLVASDRFINPRRIRCVVDVDYLVECILSVSGLSIQGLQSQDISVQATLTGADGVPRYVTLNDLSTDDELREVLTGTMSIPILYPRPALFRGVRYFDGGVGDPLPVLRLLEDRRLEKVFGVSSVSPGLLGREASQSEARMLKLLPGLPPAMKYQMLGKNALGATTDRLLDGGEFRGIPLIRVSPEVGTEMGSRLNVDRKHLGRLDEMGFADAAAALGDLEPV